MNLFNVNSEELEGWLGSYCLKLTLNENGEVMDFDTQVQIDKFVEKLNTYLNKECQHYFDKLPKPCQEKPCKKDPQRLGETSTNRVLNKNCVVMVNAQESEALQRLAFMCGYKWRYGEDDQTISYLDKEMLLFTTGGSIEFLELDNKICNVWALELAWATHQRPKDLAKKFVHRLRDLDFP